jgi:hypothetical protein
MSRDQFETVSTNIQLGLSVGMTERYSWHVALGGEDQTGPRVLFPTNPEGVSCSIP